jgi:hypothetical protein
MPDFPVGGAGQFIDGKCAITQYAKQMPTMPVLGNTCELIVHWAGFVGSVSGSFNQDKNHGPGNEPKPVGGARNAPLGCWLYYIKQLVA